jgi:hypothetical protein
LLSAAALLAGCQAEPAVHRPGAEGPLLLRAVYRDASSTMVLVIPEAGQQRAGSSDCAALMLIDTRAGQARVLNGSEVQARLRTMQLAGATRSACPRG